MEFEEINEKVQEHLKLITVTRKSLGQAVERSADFLTMTAILTDYRRELEIDKAKLTTLQEAQFSKAIKEALGKTITEKKINVGENQEYSSVREKVEEINAAISWVKSYMKIFENAHIVYRAQARGE